jgi:uncharacterized membrane protein YphA (DoxX/SURF4 family)
VFRTHGRNGNSTTPESLALVTEVDYPRRFAMDKKSAKRIAAWLVSALLAALFLMAGYGKALGHPGWIESFAAWGYPAWMVRVIGLAEVAGAILLLVPRTAQYAVALLMFVMMGATYTHFAAGETSQIVRPVLFFGLLGLIFWLRRKSRKPIE